MLALTLEIPRFLAFFPFGSLVVGARFMSRFFRPTLLPFSECVWVLGIHTHARKVMDGRAFSLAFLVAFSRTRKIHFCVQRRDLFEIWI